MQHTQGVDRWTSPHGVCVCVCVWRAYACSWQVNDNMVALGEAIVDLVSEIPGGVLAFFPSYNILKKVTHTHTPHRQTDRQTDRRPLRNPLSAYVCAASLVLGEQPGGPQHSAQKHLGAARGRQGPRTHRRKVRLMRPPAHHTYQSIRIHIIITFPRVCVKHIGTISTR